MSNELLREISHNPGAHFDDLDHWVQDCNAWPPSTETVIDAVAEFTGDAWAALDHICDECPHKYGCTSSYTEEAIGCTVGANGDSYAYKLIELLNYERTDQP